MRNPFKLHVVKFKDGTYGARKLDMRGWEYLDLHNPKYCWSRRTSYFKTDCRGTLDAVNEALQTRAENNAAQLAYNKRWEDRGTPV